MNLGPLDRTGILYVRTAVAGLGGAVTYKLGQGLTLYLTQVEIPVRTRLAADKDTQQTDAVFMTRWFDNFNNDCALAVEGHVYRVTRREEMGRREGWKIYAREEA